MLDEINSALRLRRSIESDIRNAAAAAPVVLAPPVITNVEFANANEARCCSVTFAKPMQKTTPMGRSIELELMPLAENAETLLMFIDMFARWIETFSVGGNPPRNKMAPSVPTRSRIWIKAVPDMLVGADVFISRSGASKMINAPLRSEHPMKE